MCQVCQLFKANGLISIRHHKGASHNKMTAVARFENDDQCSASSGCYQG